MNIKKISLIFILVIFFLGIAYFLYRDFYRKSIQTQVQSSAEVSTTTVSFFGDTYKNQKGKDTGTMYQNINDQIEGYRQDISANEGKEPESIILGKKNFLYRALGSYGVGVDTEDGGKSQLLESLNGLYDVYTSVDPVAKKENKNLQIIKAVSIKNLKSEMSETNIPAEFQQSNWFNDPGFQTFYKKFNGNLMLSFDFYVDNLLSENNVHTDKYLVAVEMQNAAQILDFYGSKIDSVQQKYLVNKLNDLGTKFKTLPDSTFFTYTPSDKQVVPLFNYAYSMSILYNFDSSVDGKQLSMDYDELFQVIDQTALSKDDLIYFTKVKAEIYYAKFLYNFNDKKVSSNLENDLTEIESFPQIYQDNQIFMSFFKNLMQYQIINNPDFSGIRKLDSKFDKFVLGYAKSFN